LLLQKPTPKRAAKRNAKDACQAGTAPKAPRQWQSLQETGGEESGELNNQPVPLSLLSKVFASDPF